MAVPVDPNNRLKDLGPAREIEASTSVLLDAGASLIMHTQGWTAFDFLGRGDKVGSTISDRLLGMNPVINPVQQLQMDV